MGISAAAAAAAPLGSPLTFGRVHVPLARTEQNLLLLFQSRRSTTGDSLTGNDSEKRERLANTFIKVSSRL